MTRGRLAGITVALFAWTWLVGDYSYDQGYYDAQVKANVEYARENPPDPCKTHMTTTPCEYPTLYPDAAKK